MTVRPTELEENSIRNMIELLHIPAVKIAESRRDVNGAGPPSFFAAANDPQGAALPAEKDSTVGRLAYFFRVLGCVATTLAYARAAHANWRALGQPT